MPLMPASEATKISNENHIEENLAIFQAELEEGQKAGLEIGRKYTNVKVPNNRQDILNALKVEYEEAGYRVVLKPFPGDQTLFTAEWD